MQNIKVGGSDDIDDINSSNINRHLLRAMHTLGLGVCDI